MPDLDYRARRRIAVEPFVIARRLPPDDATLLELDALAGGNIWLLTLFLEELFRADEPSLHILDLAKERIVEQQARVFTRWARAIKSVEGWHLYEKIATSGVMDLGLLKTGAAELAQRQLLEYHALIHHRQDRRIEIGPDLFREWAEGNGLIQGTRRSTQARATEGPMASPGTYLFDVAISYAFPQGDIARDLAAKLRQQGLKVFYDKEVSPELWGVDLTQHLPKTYDRACRIAVLLLSEDYVGRHWPQIEQKAAIAHAIRDGWRAILLVSVDGTNLPDIPPSVVIKRLNQDGTSLADVALELVARISRTSASMLERT